jgi:hypothetical protein
MVDTQPNRRLTDYVFRLRQFFVQAVTEGDLAAVGQEFGSDAGQHNHAFINVSTHQLHRNIRNPMPRRVP